MCEECGGAEGCSYSSGSSVRSMGISRRKLLSAGFIGLGVMSLKDLLRIETAKPEQTAQAKSVIVLFLTPNRFEGAAIPIWPEANYMPVKKPVVPFSGVVKLTCILDELVILPDVIEPPLGTQSDWQVRGTSMVRARRIT